MMSFARDPSNRGLVWELHPLLELVDPVDVELKLHGPGIRSVQPFLADRS